MFRKLKRRLEAKAVTAVIIHEANKSTTMQKVLISLFGVNWKTALTGWISGAIPIAYSFMDAYQQGAFTGKNGMALIFGVMVVLRGYLMKDATVTGTPEQNIAKLKNSDPIGPTPDGGNLDTK